MSSKVITGVLLGYISNYAFSMLPLKLGWRFMLGIGVIPSVMLGIGVLAMPESPRWLVMQGRLGDAKKVLDRTSDTLEESKTRLADIKEAAGIPQDCQDDIVAVTRESSDGSGVWRDLFIHPTPTVLHILIAGIGIHFFQQASGIDAVVLYSPRIYEKAGKISNSKNIPEIMSDLGLTIINRMRTRLLLSEEDDHHSFESHIVTVGISYC
uniref:Sugar transport protein n=1 Tax=Solanum tuberosum TaxID=4113 RepID=M1BRA9_SOLTU